jgi:hypothetical protein
MDPKAIKRRLSKSTKGRYKHQFRNIRDMAFPASGSAYPNHPGAMPWQTRLPWQAKCPIAASFHFPEQNLF